ncbi:hypothetical protein BC834DRAFT_244398 [Gloeopeniophorella convolvens]|nr:hypothetical protein BC834DRAFT_244398 [Gloeopeniophorella convolvens]
MSSALPTQDQTTTTDQPSQRKNRRNPRHTPDRKPPDSDGDSRFLDRSTSGTPAASDLHRNAGLPRKSQRQRPLTGDHPRDPHAPTGANSDEAHSQSGRPASTGSLSAPARREPTKRNPRTNVDRGPSSSSQPQDVKRGPADARPRSENKRGARFKSGLTETTADANDSPSDTMPSHKYSRAPFGDDLTSTLTRALRTPPYPECMICFNPIRPEQPSWSCNPREEKDAQSCWNTFHLKCIKPWAEKSVKAIEDAWRARGEEKKGEWRCPGCQSKREAVPRGYWCFCGSTQDPKPPRLSTPHSCGNACSRARTCGHPCSLPCHPGPCPPCMITIQNPCHCGKDIISLVCSRAAPTTGGRTMLPANRSCGRKCEKPLSCRNHVCQDVCHDGDCAPCPIKVLSRCWCGKVQKELGCGEGDERDCRARAADGEDVWVGKFDCGSKCERPFDCGIHKCPKPCHPPSFAPPVCPYSPTAITHCPCGKHSLSNPASAHNFPPGAKLVRTACTDPVPTCTSLCGKPLEGCEHLCTIPCHAGPCPPCAIPLVRPCRCGSTTRTVTCLASQAGAESTEILCNKPCGALRACGRHQCTRPCCPLASLASAAGKGKKKKVAGGSLGMDIADIEGWHQCDIICDKVLSCGNHRCEERDHKGPCPPCYQSSFEELFCHCGRTVLEPPIPCGTQIKCSYPCTRPDPQCGHSKMSHSCHEDPTPCPPCVLLTEKPCACGKTVVGNVRCSQERVSCGKPCGRPLSCGFHPCEQVCHAGACPPCTAACGKPRKLCLPAQHPCTHPCHAPSVCPETEPCDAIITVTCACGRIRQSVLCGRSVTNPAGREASQAPRCTNECALAKRNARLAEALGISPDAQGTDRQVMYSDDLISFAKLNGKFIELVEKTFSDFITSDKKVQVLPHMPPAKRKFVHDLAAVYRMDTQMVDPEPHVSVQLIRRIDTRIPAPLLSQKALPSPLGRLTDLRAPARTAPAPASRPGRGWTAVVAAPTPAPAPVRAAAPSAGWLSPGAALAGSRPASRTATPARPPSQPVAQPASQEPVPDNWEDDV